MARQTKFGKQVNVHISPETYEEIRKLAVQYQTSLSNVAREGLEFAMQELKRRRP